MEMDMAGFTYKFEEIEVEYIGEAPALISGCVEVEYDEERPQWSVGFPGAVDITDISDAVFDVLDWDEPGFDHSAQVASQNSPLWDQIIRAILPDLIDAAKADAQK
jgi:hypothetical protein